MLRSLFPVYAVESVTDGHPDKLCDQISDAILDACLKQDPKTRAGVEVFGGHGVVTVGGEMTTTGWVDIVNTVNSVISNVGYKEHVGVISNIVTQSPDIAQGVDTGGAGDQGIMYGYATDETSERLPVGVALVHQLTRGLRDLRNSGSLPWLKPDGKAEVTLRGSKVERVLVSCMHDETVDQNQIEQTIKDKLVTPLLGTEVELFVNPTGKFVQGGFDADAGLTGRKIMVDTYGGLIPHGGGCFSGKDATKVDRSAAYMARYAANAIVANGLAKECLVSVAYAIGKAEPLMLEAVDEAGKSLSKVVQEKFDFRPRAIIERLDLEKPIYQQTATFGHFGKPELPWEQVAEL